MTKRKTAAFLEEKYDEFLKEAKEEYYEPVPPTEYELMKNGEPMADPDGFCYLVAGVKLAEWIKKHPEPIAQFVMEDYVPDHDSRFCEEHVRGEDFDIRNSEW